MRENECFHGNVTMSNFCGKKLEGNKYEVDFIIVCDDCRSELFRISEYKRKIKNISKHGGTLI